MIEIDVLETVGAEWAVRAMRNPMNSWDKSDSGWCWEHKDDCDGCPHHVDGNPFCFGTDEYMIGNNDADLMHRLHDAGTEHRTYARMMFVYMDVTAPLYWWKEMDRYRMGKEQVSCSTMHKIAEKEFTLEDFSCEHLGYDERVLMNHLIHKLNKERRDFIDSKEKHFWWQMIQLLPSSYNQKRTLCLSYECCLKIIRERKNHKLDEWRQFVNVLEHLPYMEEIRE